MMSFTLDELIEFITLCAKQSKDCKHESYPAFVAVREALYTLRAIDYVEAKEEASGRMSELRRIRPDEGHGDASCAPAERQAEDYPDWLGVPALPRDGET